MAHASEANITSCKQDVDGLGAYFSTDETVETLLLGDIPEHQWFDDNIYALVQIDDEGALHTVGPEVKRHPFLVRVDKPGIDIECIGLMAKVGDDADGVQVFDGRSDISNDPEAIEWIKARGKEYAQLKSIPTWRHVKLKVLRHLGIKPVRTMFVDKIKLNDQNKIE